jgi:tetratricopeptide (TPR) repeat protein
MGRLILCYPKKAAKPYYIKNMNLHLYTIEELCYYLYDNIYFIDSSVINDELIDWIEKELELPDLSESLNKNRGNIKTFIMFILKYVGYIPNKDMEETGKLLSEMDEQSDFEKTMARAGHFIKAKKYAEAILEYKKLYEREENKQSEKLLNNMGVAYVKMFLFAQAAKWFKKAYEISNNPEIYKHYQYAAAMTTEEEIKSLSINLSENEKKIIRKDLEELLSLETYSKQKQLNEVINFKKENQIGQYYKELEQLLSEWKKEYSNMTLQ